MKQWMPLTWVGFVLVAFAPTLAGAQTLWIATARMGAMREARTTGTPLEAGGELPSSPPNDAGETGEQSGRPEQQSDGRGEPPATAPPAIPSGQGGAQSNPSDRFRWRSAVKQSLFFLAVEHGFRLATEQGTRADLKGPFFRDWFDSASNIRGWRDGDPFFVNYIGHPMQGAVTGFIQIQNDPLGLKVKPGFNRAYVKSRMRAFCWSAAYSTQFELGPLSESSIGNVGLRPVTTSRHPQAYVDLVITPVVGTAWLVGEDALDHFVVRRIEGRTANRVARLLARSFFNPGRSFANAMRGKYPWYRDGRKL